MEHNFLDEPTFATIFLRDDYSGAAMLQILFLTPNKSFITDVGPKKNISFLVENWYLSLNGQNKPYWAHPGPVFRMKPGEIWSIWPIKPILYLLKNILKA